MAFFDKFKKSKKEEAKPMAKIDEVLRALDELSEDEKQKVAAKLANPTDKNGDGKESTTEQIESAAEHIAEKGADEQSVKDRIDESVAAQERAEGDKDEQSAKDRVDEAIGEDEHIAEEQAAAEPAPAPEAYDARPDIAAIREELKNLKELVVKSQQNPEPVKSDEMKSKLDDAAAIYLN